MPKQPHLVSWRFSGAQGTGASKKLPSGFRVQVGLRTTGFGQEGSPTAWTSALSSNPPLTSLKIQQEPAVTEIEVGVVSILMHQFKQL